MSLTKYLHQVKPREESYVNHVDRVQDLLIESKNKGFAYELEIYQTLKSANLTPPNFSPPRPGGHGPDGMFMFHGTPHSLEIKLDLKADYGQGTLKYSNGYWSLSSTNTDAALEMKELLIGIGAEQFVNDKWSMHGVPNKGTVPSRNFTPQHVSDDYKRFKNEFLTVPSNILHDYYGRKGVYYIQIGGYGLYYMQDNPAKLPIPQFNPKMRLRIRVKRGGSKPIYNYRFTTALQITGKPKKSNYDLTKSLELLRK